MSKQDDRIGKPGEFRGDFTRDTFNPQQQYSRVFLQQGRVSIDADFNEQVSILHHYQRLFATAVIGPHAAPWGCPHDFDVQVDGDEYSLNAGSYFVNGLLCVNEEVLKERSLKQLVGDHCDDLDNGVYVIYLDAWESHVNWIEDLRIREQALGGTDTATRARIDWRLRALCIDQGVFERWQSQVEENASAGVSQDDHALFLQLIRDKVKPGTGTMKAQTGTGESKAPDLCRSDDSTGYRGRENQLYRVEICRPGTADEATFKWSRDNSSVVFPIRQLSGATVTLHELCRGHCGDLEVNNWVEIAGGDQGGHCGSCRLYQVAEVDVDKARVTLSEEPELPDDRSAEGTSLVRWDHSGGDEMGIPVSLATDQPHELEDGIQIQFGEAGGTAAGEGTDAAAGDGVFVDENGNVVSSVTTRFQSGDYWLIPARSASNSIEWPVANGKPGWLPPHGVVHHYAPLRILMRDDAEWTEQTDLRRVITRNWEMARDAVAADSGADHAPQFFAATGGPSAGGRKKKTAKKKTRATRKKKT
ncbi:MAG: DUF6519 domain-containing protein [Xanthomonadales bacterium]|nr:DUF6519 domain-containing protein [Xanthomonadales bacterium]